MYLKPHRACGLSEIKYAKGLTHKLMNASLINGGFTVNFYSLTPPSWASPRCSWSNRCTRLPQPLSVRSTDNGKAETPYHSLFYP